MEVGRPAPSARRAVRRARSADFCHPPLTTVAAPVEEAGRKLVDVLLSREDGVAELRQVVLPVQLRVRDSTGRP